MRQRIGWFSAVQIAIVAAVLAPPVLAQTSIRSGKEVVESVCVSCHGTGKDGAPKVGDRAAWIPRMKRGLHELTISAIRGHGGMPARGGQAQLTDAEIHNAIAYMFNPSFTASAAPAAPVPSPGAREATVGGIRVNLGLMAAEKMRAYPRGSAEASMHGGVPSGSGYVHVTVSLLDAASGAPIGGARVDVEVVQAGAATQAKALEPMAINNVPGYGNYVRLVPRTPSGFTVRVLRPGAAAPVEAKFKPQAD